MSHTNTLYAHPVLYDAEFGGYRADFPFYRQAVDRNRGRCVEVGCGSGRLWAGLTVADYVGVDASGPMLTGFHARARRRGVQVPPLVQADLRHLPLASGCAALVVLAYNLVQHMMDEPELLTCLREASRVVVPGGAVALDVFMPPGQFRQDEDYGWVEQRHAPDGSNLEVAERTVHEPHTGVQHTWLRFSAEDGATPVQELVVRRRLWAPEALLTALGKVGLHVQECWGDVDGAEWTPRSPRMMAVCQVTRGT